LGAEAVHVDAIYNTAAEVFAPCALCAILNDQASPRLQSRVIARSVNNQLAEGRHGISLSQKKCCMRRIMRSMQVESSVSPMKIVLLEYTTKLARSVAQRMDFGVATASADADRLELRPPFPPATEGCAFTCVLRAGYAPLFCMGDGHFNNRACPKVDGLHLFCDGVDCLSGTRVGQRFNDAQVHMTSKLRAMRYDTQESRALEPSNDVYLSAKRLCRCRTWP